MNINDSEQKYKQAENFLQQGDSQKARKLLTEILDNHRDYLAAWLMLANLELNSGNTEVAADAFRESLRIDPACEDAIVNLVSYHGVREEYDSCETLLREAISTSPMVARYQFLLGNLLLQKGYHSRAARHLEHALQLAPANLQIKIALAETHGKHGNFEAALSVLRSLLEVDPPVFQAAIIFANISTALNMNEDSQILLERLARTPLSPEQLQQLQATQQMLAKKVI